MFDGKYFDWNQKRIKFIIDYYTYQYFYGKTVADLGCGYADVSGALYRLGAEVSAVDVRQEHLKIVTKKYSGIKVVQANFDGPWPFFGQKFDLTLDMGLLCHLSDFESHLKAVCSSTVDLVLETAVCDSDDPTKCVKVPEGKEFYDLAYNGMGSRPSAAFIEKILTDCGMTFKRVDSSKLNAADYVYDWQVQNSNNAGLEKRRMWFATKTSAGIALPEINRPQIIQAPASNIAPAAAIQNSGVPTILTASPKPPRDSVPTESSVPNTAVPHAIFVPDPAPVAPPPPPPPPPLVFSTAPTYYPAIETNTDRRFVIVIPSYKNSQWCEKNIQSCIDQNYKNYRVIFTDDCSPDDTFEKVSNVVNASSKASQFALIKNSERKGALENLYNMIHSCEDDEIVLTLDGDDWLPHYDVLNKLNATYSDTNIWMTYGQYKNSTDGGRGVAKQYPDHIIQSNSFRQHPWGASHLRAFYTWLFKSIKKEDLMWQGKFFPMTWDFAIMFPMLEMAGPHSRYLDEILYVYNLENPINDHKVNVRLQQQLDSQIRAMPKYARINASPKTTIGLMMIATGKYDRFIQGLITSADNYFFRNEKYDVTYYVFSDKEPRVNSTRKVVYLPIEHRPFPFASMDRFKHFTNNAGRLTASFLYYVDVDSLFVDHVAQEVLGSLVGVRHCGFYNSIGPYENNPASSLYVDASYPTKYKYYFGGGFSGGRRGSYLHLASWCSERIEKDVANGIIPIWHDETAINRYFLDNEPPIVLTPSYHYPQSNINYYKTRWNNQSFHPRIMLLDKNHHEVRT